jgi:hypothetical protein
MDDARAVLDGLDAPVRRCLELAWESWCAGSIGVGAVVVDERTGAIVSAAGAPLADALDAVAGLLR